MSGSKPEVIAVASQASPEAVVGRAAQALRAGQLVVLPTDTVYGLACRADLDDAVRALYAAKGRGAEKALPILLPDARGLDDVCQCCPEEARRLAEAFWPGPLTLVVRKTPRISDLVTGGRPTVGVRVPDCELTRRLLAACRFPVAVTSANLSGEAPAVAVGELAPALVDHVSLVLDAGCCPGGQASTVLDLTTEPYRILRPGPVSAQDLAAVLRQPVTLGK